MRTFKTIQKSDYQNVKFLIDQNEALFNAKKIDKKRFIKNSLSMAAHLENMLNGHASPQKSDLSPTMLEFQIEQLKPQNRN
ncbi:hypothetical protein ASG31_17700 [Chryseobacterium sp. Leaf404]|uniref:hypothetical protein n=1 Tax=unclassified Chryseobacterium TaxID=2593645 RepID=UPI0006FB5EE1|nr:MULTISPECIES: hypothetical protein [unclassified Chryseobacterium]KQT20264.1 hypothetical protein ASG31_17700 [Chryseobacterium sp. Leaf404]